MTDPHTTMSLTAVLVLTAVVMVTVVGWLVVVFLAGHQPAGGRARPGSGDTALARRAKGRQAARGHARRAYAAPLDGQPTADEPAG
jgi:hypothetical protein